MNRFPKIQLKKLGNPMFLFALGLLITNDWFFKAAFHNAITGKVSDFAGLFAFAWFMTVLMPTRKLVIHVATALLFLFWKTSLADPAIELINLAGLPVNRTVDITDAIALLSLPLSFCLFDFHIPSISNSCILRALIVVSCFAFVATTLPKQSKRTYTNINKQYSFDIPRDHLISRINALQLKEVAMTSRMSGGRVRFDSKQNTFHFGLSTDTLALILDPASLGDSDQVQLKTSYATITIQGNDLKSTLTLVSVYRFAPAHKEKDYREKAIRLFERRVVKKLRKMSTGAY